MLCKKTCGKNGFQLFISVHILLFSHLWTDAVKHNVFEFIPVNKVQSGVKRSKLGRSKEAGREE